MNYTEWSSKINKLKFNDRAKIKNLLSDNTSRPKRAFQKITDSHVYKALATISNKSDVIIAFDVEFQNAISEGIAKPYMNSKTDQNDRYATMCRELGASVFVFGKNSSSHEYKGWYHIGDLLAYFPLACDYEESGFTRENMKYIQSTYSSVSVVTRGLMKENDQKFKHPSILDDISSLKQKDDEPVDTFIDRTSSNIAIIRDHYFMSIFGSSRKEEINKALLDISNEITKDSIDNSIIIDRYKRIVNIYKELPFLVFGRYIKDNSELTSAFMNQIDIYSDDISSSLMTKTATRNFISSFVSIGYHCTYIIKGDRDITAIKNHYVLTHNSKAPYFDKNIYDIERYNYLSYVLCGDGKLETTFACLEKTNIYKDHVETYIDASSSSTAHNPLIDALFTIAIAITINSILFKYLSDVDPIAMDGGAKDEIYKQKYIKYKRKYLETQLNL